MKKQIVGYTAGVYDMFHVGPLNLLRNAKEMCDKLIVGVSVDELVSYKNTQPIIPFEDRIDIVRSIKYVDVAVPQRDIDKYEMCKKLKVDYLFVGDDWYRNDKWEEYEKKLNEIGTQVVYFPYTRKVSTTSLKEKMKHLNN